MSYLHRVTPNNDTTSKIEGKYNEKGQLVDANTKEVLVQGKIDRGHKHGYEERVMKECAERCHMTQKDYNKMMQNSKLYQFESSHNNRTHQFESKDRMLQLHNCFEVIRDYKGKNRNKVIEKYGKSEFTFGEKSKSSKSRNSVQKTNNHNTTEKASIVNGNIAHSTTQIGSKGSSIGGHHGLVGGHSNSTGGHSSSSGGHGGLSGSHGGSSGGHGGSSGGHGGSGGGHGGSSGGHGGSSGGHGGSSGGHGGSGGGHGR